MGGVYFSSNRFREPERGGRLNDGGRRKDHNAVRTAARPPSSAGRGFLAVHDLNLLTKHYRLTSPDIYVPTARYSARMSVLDRFRLDGETVIVTGGNRGIGKGIATGMAEVGANVVVANRTAESGQAAAEEIADETGAETAAIPTDVTDEAEVQAMVEETVDRFGSVDVLVNNAGVAIHEPAEEKPLENWQKTLDINTTGAFICAKHAGREMIDGDGGSIVNISSMSAFVANYPQCQVDYQASKGGLEGLKLQLASEWAEHGIRVNNINPGYIETDILTDDEELIETWKSEMLLDEFGTPEDIAPLAVYLASDAAAYVTGSSFLIDGGYMVR